MTNSDIELLMKVKPTQKNATRIPFELIAEIDLHIESLIKNSSGLSNAEMLSIQLNAFQKAIDKAIMHHTKILYVIHGVGSGKLKSEIHLLLNENKFVASFKNQYHPLYGFGATEVVLKN